MARIDGAAQIDGTASAVGIEHPFLGALELLAARRLRRRRGRTGAAVLRERDQPRPAVRRRAARPRTPRTASTTTWSTARPRSTRTSTGHQVRVLVPADGRSPAQTAELRLRLRPAAAPGRAARPATAAPRTALRQRGVRAEVDRPQRRAEADEFYAELTPAGASADEALVHAAGVRRDAVEQAAVLLRRGPLAGRRPGPAGPAAGARAGRNARWRNFNAFDIMSMPDKWEYPWFAAWDLAFHCVALAHVDPAFAKYQLILLCREWFQHPNGALPAYEWDFGDVNPPVQAWAALEVFAIDGGRDLDFLARIFDKLLVNFTWWVNREDALGQQPVRGRLPRPGQHRPDRPVAPAAGTRPGAVRRHRLDGLLRAGDGDHRRRPERGRRSGRAAATWCSSSWSTSPRSRRPCDDQGMWDDERRDLLRPAEPPNGTQMPVKARSMVGMIPLLAPRSSTSDMLQNALPEQAFTRFLRTQGSGTTQKLGRDARSCAASGRPAAAAVAWPGPASWSGCSPSCSTRASSCPRTGCARCRPTTGTIPTCSTSRATRPPSTTSRPSRPRRCSAATPTGAARSGSRSTTW